ncbi:unnamed protein product [Tilletia controversa]|uniref:Protein LURP-one-related 15 n=3 Tax=Tilletia TaxID=13289 RepID=A0A8X7MRT0_9BASI|nr:hypothetical protein CF336_g5233 [Tilletia laevis]KAE8194203.1 hypothetical protein CF328_g4820 [Tilletia controversa]KAE8258052.1 hypothetical protein A4X03_0g4495 [Tilletia caries]KAE8197833.1 hypothetical protein CF335_g4523 [Tilletia laevis]KAE8245785.1 hypothetical protein A4X06_0g5420 [Tilletia controversa]
MGLFNSSNAPEPAAVLAPVPHPIGVLPQYTIHTQQMALKIRERKTGFSGDNFKVKDAVTDQSIFQVDGKAFSLSSSKHILDANGQTLFTLKKKLISIHMTYEGYAPNTDEPLFTVKSGFSFGTKLTASFTNRAAAGGGAAGEPVTLVLKGDLFDRKAEICTEAGVPVARISRSFANMGQLFFDTQTYILTIAPGVDAALLLAICIVLDEKANEDKH